MRWIPLLFLVSLSSQDPVVEPAGPLAWKLARNEFARYEPYTVQVDADGSETVLPNPARLAGIFGYEIEEKTLYRPGTLDLNELPLLLGFSLPPKQFKPGQSQEWTIELEETFDCGPVTAKCTATRAAAVAIEDVPCAKIDLAVRLSRSLRAPPPAKAKRAIERGQLQAALFFDPAKGVARRLTFHLTLSIVPADSKGRIEKVDAREQLDLVEVLPVRHRQFEREVNAAIDRGLAYVWRTFDRNKNHWGAHHEHATGPTALALLTILKGSMDRKDERLLAALDWLMSQPLQHTYDVAISLMALEAFYSPTDANRKAPPAAADKDIQTRMDDGHGRWGVSAARWLEQVLAKEMWSYPSTDLNARDFSNTQYGVLGLYSAARCGFAPDLEVVRRVHESYLRVQQKKGPRTELSLQEGEAAGKTIARYMAEARGWPYYDHPEDPVYGSMTAGGVSSLVILDALRRRGADPKYGAREQARVRAGIRDGWAWLLTHWTVKGNPLHGRDWTNYFLYGMERAAMLDGVGRVGDHDWYGEGAMFLVANQASDGTWRTGKYLNLYDNCFAILFLKRATVRVATGK